jgi:hypothetical protein
MMMGIKSELDKKCQHILHSPNPISKEEHNFLLSIILNKHPHATFKVGCGIKKFYIKKNIYGNKSFYLKRLDNTETDFSFKECISPKSKKRKIKDACRTAIVDYVKQHKTDKNGHLHHIIPFNSIFNEWYNINRNILDFTLNPPKDGDETIYFVNKETSQSFYDYHSKIAQTTTLSKEEHRDLHKKGNIKYG